MHELAAKDIPNERKMIPKPEALELYRQSNQEFKCELVEEKASEPMVSFYSTGKFLDFCRDVYKRQFFDGVRWWVVTIFWQEETPDTPLPKEFLPAAH